MLSNAPKWSALERPSAPGVKAVFFDGLPFQGKPTRVFAWLGLPKLNPGEKAPGMVLVHGGGGTAFDEWVRLWTDRGYAAIAMDTCGQVPVGTYAKWVRDPQGGPPGWGGLDQMDRAPTDQWTYHAVADAILAHSLLRSLPEVDPDRIGVTGISWGGYLTCILAGVDSRFRLAVPVYGCGFTDRHAFAPSLAQLGPERAAQWMAWWDPSVYLPTAQMPLLWVTGSNDFAYTFNALQLSYRLPPGPRTLCIRLRMPHGHGGAGENPEEIRVFADSILKSGVPLAKFTEQGRDGRKVWARYSSERGIRKAELNYTVDTGKWQDRRWEALPATFADGLVSATLPDQTRVYYINLFDDRDCVVSTEHEELPAVVPLPQAHAHNDYEHTRPLLDALDHGFCSVEADIYLVDGQLLVAHDRSDVRPERTLQALYLDPLRQRVRDNGGRVYPGGPPVLLLIDFKSEAESTYAALRTVLEGYSEMLTRFSSTRVVTNAVTVVISGNRPKDTLAQETARHAAIDGRPEDLDGTLPPSLIPLVSEDWKRLFAWRGTGPFPDAQRQHLRDLVARAHAQGRKVRFWGTPDRPEVWTELHAAKADLLNADDLAALRHFLLQPEHAQAPDVVSPHLQGQPLK